MCTTLLILWSTDGHLSSLHLLAFSGAMNLQVRVIVWVPVFSSFGYSPQSGISGLYNSSVFNSLRNYQTVFYGGCTILASRQQCPVSLHPQHLVFLFFNRSHPSRYLIVVLISISLLTNNVEYLLLCISYIREKMREKEKPCFWRTYFQII